MGAEKGKKPKGKKAAEEEAAKPEKGKKRKLEEAAAEEPDPSEKKRQAKEPAEKEPKSTAEGVSEDDRRSVQREIQQLVTRLRGEGKSKAEIDAAKRDLKAKFGGSLRQPTSSRVKKKEAWQEKQKTKEAEDQRKENRTKEHELVIIPVFWRGRHDKLDVVKAAEDIKALVAQQGVDAWVDSRRHYTPGQKFAHWEHRGVMLRVEIGPEDLEAGVCRVCLAKTPGEYKTVERKKVNLPPSGARSVLLALKEFGLSKIDIERRSGDSADEEEAEESANAQKSGKIKAPATEEEAVDEELGGNWQPRMKTTPKGAAGGKKKGGKKK